LKELLSSYVARAESLQNWSRRLHLAVLARHVPN
jgi:hypothetical protein